MLFDNFHRLKAWLIRSVLTTEQMYGDSKSLDEKQKRVVSDIQVYLKLQKGLEWIDEDFLRWEADKVFEELIWFSNNSIKNLSVAGMEYGKYTNSLAACVARVPSTPLEIKIEELYGNAEIKTVLDNRLAAMYDISKQRFYDENDEEDYRIKKEMLKTKITFDGIFSWLKSLFAFNSYYKEDDTEFENCVGSSLWWTEQMDLRNPKDWVKKPYKIIIEYLRPAMKAGYMAHISSTYDLAEAKLNEIKDVYRQYIWYRYRLDEVPYPANKVCLYLGTNYNEGYNHDYDGSRFRSMIQKILNACNIEIENDWYYGPKTFMLLKRVDPDYFKKMALKVCKKEKLDIQPLLEY